MPRTKSNDPVRNDEIDFRAIFVVLWKQRKLIIFGTLGATLLAAIISFIVPKVYRSEGFYQLSSPKKTNAKEEAESEGISIPLFKNTSTQFSNPNRFQLVAGHDRSFSETDLKAIRNNFRMPADITKWISPLYAYSKDDTRQLAQISSNEPNSVIGLTLFYEAHSPEKASNFVRFLGTYVRDCLLYVTLYGFIMDEYALTGSSLNINENTIIDTQFNLQLNTKKLQDIKEILKKYPDSARIDNRQLVSVQDGGGHFLSPITQLVGIESSLADIRQSLAQLQRQKEELTIRNEYFIRCRDELKSIGEQGGALLLLLQTIESDVFKNKDMNQDSVKQTYNDLARFIQDFHHTFYDSNRFISGPTVLMNPIKPKKRSIVLATFFITLFVLVFWVLTHHWWEKNIMVKHSGL